MFGKILPTFIFFNFLHISNLQAIIPQQPKQLDGFSIGKHHYYLFYQVSD